jgi:oxygen-independent coproporphyrinogen-3 oxidase
MLGYIQTLQAEVQARQIHLTPLKTLYCGGGTPGLIGSEGFKALQQSGLFTFAKDYEWSVELHPATVTPELMATLAECGVTRISIGVQSFDDNVLQYCNRRHTVAQALHAIQTARAAIPDTGIDLIAGLPGVSAQQWRDTLTRTLELDLPHLSIYSLSIDEGSAWAQRGIPPPDADVVCDAIAEASECLHAAGFIRYETSNYARPSYECRHNLNTWHGGDYVGLGRGAVSRIGTVRRYGDGSEERLSPLDDALERALTALRLNSGFNLEQCEKDFPCLSPFIEQWRARLHLFQQQGLLTDRFAPTTRGYEVLDAMERTLLEVTQ